ncbi:MAG TPA: hypothetical protein DCZ43_10560, partial [candidate division Zixibacteria bacterium]|nr:hypothetical protein [candidate division Zixibacteria bacterium]
MGKKSAQEYNDWVSKPNSGFLSFGLLDRKAGPAPLFLSPDYSFPTQYTLGSSASLGKSFCSLGENCD